MRLKQVGDRITGAQGRQGMGSNEEVIGICLGSISLGGLASNATLLWPVSILSTEGVPRRDISYKHPYLMYLITRPITVHGESQGRIWHQCRGEAVDAAGSRFLWLVRCKGTG